jgi:uncharacterized protein (TIGR03435 family)
MGIGRVRRTAAALAFEMVLVWATPCVLSAQEAQTNSTTKPPMMAKEADPHWDVTTVKPADPNGTQRRIVTDGRRIRLEGQTVERLIVLGYGVQRSQIVDAPDWVSTERFDIEGLSDAVGQPNGKQLQRLLRKVLEDRFGVKVHRDQRILPVYALTVTKGGAKLTKSADDPNGQPIDYGGNSNGSVNKRFVNTSMPDFILTLLFYADRPVLDQTGLQGRYDFKLQWTADETHTTEPDAPPGLFTAIQEQIGLKLEPVKAAADVIVIDRVERPGAN